MRICLVYDCLFPYTVGGAERWYRNLARAARRRRPRGHLPDAAPVGPRRATPTCRACAWSPPGRGWRCTAGAARGGSCPRSCSAPACSGTCSATAASYDVVHTASFPYFSLLAAGARAPAAPASGSWWTGTRCGRRDYWREYLGRLGGRGRLAGAARCACASASARSASRACTQRGCARRACAASPTVLEGEYAGPLEPAEPRAGRAARGRSPGATSRRSACRRSCRRSRWPGERLPELRGEIFGDGPERDRGARGVAELGLEDVVSAPGFVDAERGGASAARALCMVLPSRREGYGLVVVEAAARGDPQRGGGRARQRRDRAGRGGRERRRGASDSSRARGGDRARARGGAALRTPAAWFERNARRLSLERSLERVAESYGPR